MLPERDRGKIEGLSEELYSRTRYKNPEDVREEMPETDAGTAPEAFQSAPIDDLLASERRGPEPYPLIKKIFLVAVLFCICAVVAAALIYFKGDNFISTKNLDISVEGPVSVSAGSPVELLVTVKNGNNAALSTVNLNITYPEGTRDATDATTPLAHTKEVISNLGAGGKVTKTEHAIFLGALGEVKDVHMTVDYKVSGSNAVFTKEKVFEVTIGNSPVSISVTHPESITSGVNFTTTVNVVANSEEVLKNVILRAEYPYGWTAGTVSPTPTGPDLNIWPLGDLSPGEKKAITLKGSLLGEDGEERTFRFFVGSGQPGSNTFDTDLTSDSIVIAIQKPSLELGVLLNGDSSSAYAAQAGKPIRAEVSYKNNLSSNLLSPQIQVKITGNALDRSTVSPLANGFYNSASNSVIWSGDNDPDLAKLSPGTDGTVTLNFATLSNLPPGTSNQTVSLAITLSGVEQDNNTPVSVTENRTVKIASSVALSSKSLYSRGPFTNSGPIPPKAEQQTTYTVVLDLGNTQNDVTEAKVTGVLGANVKWLGQTSPVASGLSYDEGTRTVTWDMGTLASGTGFATPGKEAAFQVSLTPSLGQVGAAPVLLGNTAFTGTDSFTKVPVRVTTDAVTTRISSDPSYVQGNETVVK